MKRLCTICARGGSKGVKDKNIRPLMGKPLLAHSLEHAQASGLFDAIAVSSDSTAILEIANTFGADYCIERPPALASDTAGKVPAIQHCVKTVESLTGHRYQTCVDLDATSPLRIAQDIVAVVELLETKQVANVLTAAPARRSPYFNLVEVDDNDVVRLSKPRPSPTLRRQDSPPCYDMNASIYAWQREALLEHDSVFLATTALYVMPEDRSHDIDSELDFAVVEMLMQRRLTGEAG